VYLSEVLTSRNLPLYDLQFKTSFMVRFQSFRHPKKIEDIAKGLYMGGSKQAVYKVSDKMGMMQMFSKKWIGKEWQDVFVLLCDVGLILFKKLGDLEPLLFVPLAEALVIKNPKAVDRQRPNMIKVVFSTDGLDLLPNYGLGDSVLY
jgi:serine/threonine-protein phosphatase PP1 catalytic subunit